MALKPIVGEIKAQVLNDNFSYVRQLAEEAGTDPELEQKVNNLIARIGNNEDLDTTEKSKIILAINEIYQDLVSHKAEDVPHPNIKTINIEDYLSLVGHIDKDYSPLLLHYGGKGTTTPKYEKYLFTSEVHGGELLPNTKIVATFTLTNSVAYSFKVSFTGSQAASVPTVQSYAEKTIFFHQHNNNITMVEEFDGLLRNFVSDDISIESVGSGNQYNLVIKSPTTSNIRWLLNVEVATGRGTIGFNNIEVVSI